jgi:seryl-tRNA synthetase
MVAFLEHYQTPEGTVRVPEVIRPYLGGASELGLEPVVAVRRS